MTRRTKIPTAQELAQHARQLANAFHVQLIEAEELTPEGGMARQLQLKGVGVVGHQVAIKPITDETSYAVALHEIGHCAAPCGFIPGANENIFLSLQQEQAAWEWARHYALDWTVGMEQVANYGLGTYEKDAQRERDAKVRREVVDKQREQKLRNWVKKL